MKILVINGPNLNFLGKRETEHYGYNTLESLEEMILNYAQERNVEIECFQSNFEGEILEYIYDNYDTCNGIVINPGALTHNSYSLRDCLKGVLTPFVEVHISNIYNREDFRKKSVISDIAKGTISGLGINAYLYAIDYFVGNNSEE